VLPRGDQRVRVRVAIGAQQIVSAARRVQVRRARRWSTRAADDGRYAGRIRSRSVRFTVAGRGRQLRGFRAFVPMLCPGLSPGQFTTQIGTATVGRTRIAPDGRFVAVSTPGDDTAISLRGRLRHRKVSGGRVQLSVGNCSGSASFRAGRAAP
jgi:multidrug efflux pump subunit AcrA (membrane-fusion protein)